MPAESIIGKTIVCYAQVDSTNSLMRVLAERGYAEGLVITAQEQTAGRGRLGRKWIVPRGTSLQFSVLLRPPLPARHAPRLMPMAGLAVAYTLDRILRLRPRLKWPNDVLIPDEHGTYKKVCGILTESSMQGDVMNYVVLGIGLNVNYTMSAYPELAPLATTIRDSVGHPVDREALERELFSELDTQYRRVCRGESLREEYRAHLGMLGQPVRIAEGDKILDGIASDVDEDGALILAQGEAQTKVLAGQVTIVKDKKEVV